MRRVPLQSNSWLIVLGIAWVAGVGTGIWKVTAYANTPGIAAEAPEHWPSASRIARVPGHPVLIMLAHPHCPCTRASLGELARLMARVQGEVSASVLFLAPSGYATDWYQTDLWDDAAAIPGVQAIADDGGREAALFHAATSGQTFLYDAQGRLRFSGGITVARGHSGDNEGFAALLASLTTGTGGSAQAAVYGCPLRGAATDSEEVPLCPL